MIRCPHRINFRLTAAEFQRYASMIGPHSGSWNWTELCKKALEELKQRLDGPAQPLGCVPATEAEVPSQKRGERRNGTRAKKKTPGRRIVLSDGTVFRRLGKSAAAPTGKGGRLKRPDGKGR